MTTSTTVQPIFSVEEVARELEYVTNNNREMRERLEDLRGLTIIGIPILFLFSLIILTFVCVRGLEPDHMKKKVQVLEKKLIEEKLKMAKNDMIEQCINKLCSSAQIDTIEFNNTELKNIIEEDKDDEPGEKIHKSTGYNTTDENIYVTSLTPTESPQGSTTSRHMESNMVVMYINN